MPALRKGMEEAREFHKTQKSQLVVWRCNGCQGIYNLYSGTVFEGKHFRPVQVVRLLHGVCKDEPAVAMVREIGISRQTVHALRKAL
jgi:hypothetical protein